MKKLKFKALEISGAALLTREQLRNVMGKGSVGQQCTSAPNAANTCGGNLICVDWHCADPNNPCPTGYYYYSGTCHPCNGSC